MSKMFIPFLVLMAVVWGFTSAHALPDLEWVYFEVDEEEVNFGGTLTGRYCVVNSGNSPNYPYVAIGLSISEDCDWDENEDCLDEDNNIYLPALDPGESVEGTFSMQLPTEEDCDLEPNHPYKLLAYIDFYQDEPELDETNNLYCYCCISFEAGQCECYPEVWVQENDPIPETIEVCGSYDFVVWLKNNGPCQARRGIVSISFPELDNDALLDWAWICGSDFEVDRRVEPGDDIQHDCGGQNPKPADYLLLEGDSEGQGGWPVGDYQGIRICLEPQGNDLEDLTVNVRGALLGRDENGEDFWFRSPTSGPEDEQQCWHVLQYNVDVVPLSEPSWVTAERDCDIGGRVELDWDDNNNRADGYKLFRKELPNGSWEEIADVEYGPYNDTDVDYCTAYKYYIKAYCDIAESDPTPDVDAPVCPLNRPTNGSPNDETCVSIPVQFNWPNINYADGYIIQIDEDCNFNNPVERDISNSSYDWPNAEEYTEYCWRVRAYCGVDNNGDWSNCWSFSTGGSIDSPTLQYPDANATCVSNSSIEFNWSDVANASEYVWEISENENFDPVLESETVTNSGYTWNNPESYTEYFWRVKAISEDNCAESSWRDRSFSTGGELEEITLIEPDDAAEFDDGDTITFKWESIENIDNYIFQIDYSGGSPAFYDTLLPNNDSIQWSGQTRDSTYDWRVIGEGPCDTVASETRSFNVRSGITELEEDNIPTEYTLMQNYPNPFNAITTIKFGVPSCTKATLTVFNVLGQELETVVNEQLDPGYYQVYWDSREYSSGIYYYQLSTSEEVITKRMTLLK